MDTIVYTCVTDQYDNKLMPAANAPGVSFVCFTDRPGSVSAPGWDILPLQSPPSLKQGHYINRYHKFFPHHLFPNTRWSIYVDGNLHYAGVLADLVSRVDESGAEIGAFVHPHLHSLHKEAEICGLSKFDTWDFARVKQQLIDYESDGVNLNAPIPACYILVRDHSSPNLANAMSLWWSQIFEYTKRDQMSFTWMLAKSGLKLLLLDGDGGVDPALLQRAHHSRPPFWKRARTRAGSFWGEVS